MDLFYYALGWMGYYTIHSILAADQSKEVLQKTIISSRWYRLLYNGIAIVLLINMVSWHQGLAKNMVFIPNWVIIISGGVILSLGGFLGVLALRQYNLSEFMGTAYLSSEINHGELNTAGLNAQVRHPLYLATLLIIWGLWVIFPSWPLLIPVLVTTIYIPIGVYFEELKLIKVFGDDYIKYKSQVPMLFPRKK